MKTMAAIGLAIEGLGTNGDGRDETGNEFEEERLEGRMSFRTED